MLQYLVNRVLMIIPTLIVISMIFVCDYPAAAGGLSNDLYDPAAAERLYRGSVGD